MGRLACVSLLAALAVITAVAAARELQIIFIDVEGGQATLLVSPAGESLLIDAGYGQRNGRDPDRIMKAVSDAGLSRIDYLLVTHFHTDHVGGVPELADRVAIGTFVDYGNPLGTDRGTNNPFRGYEPVRAAGRHVVARPGDRIPMRGLRIDIVSAGGELIPKPLRGGGEANTACTRAEDHPEDGTENYRSVGVMVEYGDFRFLDLGDLSGNTLTRIVCPQNLLGQASVYLVSHHGDYDTNVPVLYAGVRPRVAILNHGTRKGGSSDAIKTLRAQPDLEDFWQLHKLMRETAPNNDDAFVANIDEESDGHPLRLTARDDGSFEIENGRTGWSKRYGRRRGAPAQD